MDKLEFYVVEDVMRILGVSKSKGYKIMQAMNKELTENGYFIIAGKVPKKYFTEKFYFEKDESNKIRKMA